MKKLKVIIWTGIFVITASGSIFAQDHKMDMSTMPKEEMKMSEMSKSPHHVAMMAYRHSLLSFATGLRDLAPDGKIQDVDLARNVFGELKLTMAKMDAMCKDHMSKMSPEMSEKMKPMMEKMQTEKAAIKEHINALEKAFQPGTPDSAEVAKHSNELVLQLEKMKMPEGKAGMACCEKMKI